MGVIPPVDATPATLWIRTTFAATATAPEVRTDRSARISFVRGRSGTARLFLPIRCGDRSVGCVSVRPELCTVSVRCREQNTTCGDFGECSGVDLPVLFAGEDAAMTDAVTGVDALSGRLDGSIGDVPSTPIDAGSDVIADASMCTASEIALGNRCVDRSATPRPTAPVSLGDVTQRRPTLRFSLPPIFDGAVIELCADRACTTMIERVSAVGSSGRPSRDLPARSVVFWRLRGTVAMDASPAVSPTWLFHVPAVSASGGIDSSSHPHNDVNGDGFDDVVMGSPFANPSGRMQAGTATVYHGGPAGLGAMPAILWEGVAAGERLGFAVSGAGDVNGDGFGDILVGSSSASSMGLVNAGAVSVFFGSPTGAQVMPFTVLAGTERNASFGRSVSNAGDINANGYADILIGAPTASPAGRADAGTVSVFLGGGPGGLELTPARVFEGVGIGDGFGTSVSSAGDANGDGLSDFLVGAPLADPSGRADVGSASMYYGSRGGVAPMPARVFEGVLTGDSFGRAVSGVGDLDSAL